MFFGVALNSVEENVARLIFLSAAAYDGGPVSLSTTALVLLTSLFIRLACEIRKTGHEEHTLFLLLSSQF